MEIKSGRYMIDLKYDIWAVRSIVDPVTMRIQPCYKSFSVFGRGGVIWKFRSTFWLGNSIRSFAYGFRVVVRDIWEWRPGFYSEFRYKSCEHSDLGWGAILRKMLVLTFCAELQCSFFQEQVPKWILSQMFQTERSM